VHATDPDSGPNGNFTYFLFSGNPAMFSVNPTTGVVYALQNLLYAVAPNYTLLIGAQSLGGASTNCLIMMFYDRILSLLWAFFSFK
jgi:hypothetical protein